ncbi:phytanoyl-CoA dioxygenase family protein [Pseudomonadales bacterium]|nr:phytanoyl-CoA dioxygenase family protein [Pseudomonadales bacterium]
MFGLLKEAFCFLNYQVVRLIKHSKLNEKGLIIFPKKDFGLTENDIAGIKGEIDTGLKDTSDIMVFRDDQGSDMRLYGFENIYSFNPSLLERVIAFAKSSHCKDFSHFSVVAARMKYVEGNAGSGGGWHRDSAHRSQVKAIIYLSDVTELNGPFQYVPSSHWVTHLLKHGGLFSSKLRYTTSEVDRMRAPITVTAKAGSGIVVDTKGVHRGKPMESGERYALTFYFFDNGAISPAIKSLTNGEISKC